MQPCDCVYDSLREEIRAKDEIICNICTKYLKIKATKQSLQKKLEVLELQTQKVNYNHLFARVLIQAWTNYDFSTQVCENIVNLLQSNKISIDSLLRRLVTTSGTITDGCKKY